MDDGGKTTAYDDSKTHLEKAARHFNAQNDEDNFLIAAQECLEHGQHEALLEVLRATENEELLCFVGWDLAKMVFQFLPDDCLKLGKSEIHKTILYLICNACNPREICLSLSEVLSQELAWGKLVILLRLLTLACSRLEGKIGKILVSIFSSIQRCFRNRNDLVEHTEILENTLEFVGAVVGKTQSTLETDDIRLLKEGLLSFLIGLLENPFSLLEFSIGSKSQEEQVKRNLTLAETIIGFLGILEKGCLKRVLDYGVYHGHKTQRTLELSEDDDVSSLSFIGIGCLAFLTYVLRIGAQFIPVMTTGKYVLDTNIVYINAMLCVKEAKVISKGLILIMAVSNMIEANTLDHTYMDNKEMSNLFVNLRNLMIHSGESEIRQDAVKGFRKILSLFTTRGKYRLLRTLHQGEIQPGFAELLNLILKEEIVKSLQDGGDNSWFLGSNLRSFLLENIFQIPYKALQSEFGMIEQSNFLLSALNLLRFLLIRDHENRTTVHTIFPKLKDTYLKQLRDVVQLSRARIGALVEEKQDEIKKGVSASKKAPRETIFNVTTADGGKLDQGSLAEQVEVLHNACLTLDMIESVLARIGEISSDKRTKVMEG